MVSKFIFVVISALVCDVTYPAFNCRDRNSHMRQDGGLCFEIPPWQHQPVELEAHLERLHRRWANSTKRMQRASQTVITINSEVSRYMDTVLAPYLDTYHRNIQNSYQQFTAKILKIIKEEINAAVMKKNQIYTNLIKLADKLKVPAMCDEERREARTIASEHVAKMYGCAEDARASITKMVKYAEEMISITRNHMEATVNNVGKSLDTDKDSNNLVEVPTLLRELSQAAVALGYELDLSLTNARRHNEQSCEKLSSCIARVRHLSDQSVTGVKEKLYQCVYA